MESKIYTIASIWVDPVLYDNEDHWLTTIGRMMGWFLTIEEAENAVLENHGDIHECRYNFACIEESFEGIQNGGWPKMKFQWNDEKYCWEKIESFPFIGGNQTAWI